MSIGEGRFDLGGGLVVDPGLTEARLRAQRPEVLPLVHNGPWRSWRLGTVTLAGERFAANAFFHHGRVWQLHLFLLDAGPDPAEEKAAHDAFLARTLGPPPYRFGWGRIDSEIDPRSDGASIIVGLGPSPFG